jgi:lipopolysaccharide export system permease protein
VKLVDRYVAGEVVRHFAYALASLVAVFAVVNLTEELRGVEPPAWGVGRALWFVALTLPAEAYTLLPAAALLGAVLALGRMASEHELIALQAAGVSRARVAAATLVAAAMLAAGGAVLGEVIAAPLSQRAHQQRAAALSGGRALSTASGVWLRDGSRFVNVGTIRPDGSLAEVYVFEFDGRRALERSTYARAAARVDDAWRLEDVRESAFHAEGVTTRRAAVEPWATSIRPQQLRALWLEPRDLSLTELYRTIRALREQRQNPLGYQVAFWQRATTPVYIGVMVLLAVPLVLVGRRPLRIGERATIGALVGLGFQLLKEMFTNLGLVAGFPPLVTALVPALVALTAVSALFRWQRNP